MREFSRRAREASKKSRSSHKGSSSSSRRLGSQERVEKRKGQNRHCNADAECGRKAYSKGLDETYVKYSVLQAEKQEQLKKERRKVEELRKRNKKLANELAKHDK